MLGKAYLKTKNYKALPSVFERILKIKPNSASAHVMMGTAYDGMSDRDNALKEYQAAAQADPNFQGVHSGLGYLYWRQGDSDRAGNEMRAELEHHPGDPVANCILGQILFNNSQLASARSHFEQALKANPRYGDALLGLGKTNVALKQPDLAIAPLRKAIELDANSVEAHYVLGTALKQTGHTAEGTEEQKLSITLQNKKAASNSENPR
jgi:Tfp pilus assembly protein PilF